MSSIHPNNELENVNFCPSLLGQKFLFYFWENWKKTKSPFEIKWALKCNYALVKLLFCKPNFSTCCTSFVIFYFWVSIHRELKLKAVAFIAGKKIQQSKTFLFVFPLKISLQTSFCMHQVGLYWLDAISPLKS